MLLGRPESFRRDGDNREPVHREHDPHNSGPPHAQAALAGQNASDQCHADHGYPRAGPSMGGFAIDCKFLLDSQLPLYGALIDG